MEQRLVSGHRADVAWRNEEPAAWGWVATSAAIIGELGASVTLAPRQRYLWNFVTLPTHRGLGIYPRLLQAIVRGESSDAEQFWIAYAPENHASARVFAKPGLLRSPNSRSIARATRSGVAAALKDTTTGASQRSRLHHTFVVVQVMFTQPLLMFVGMMIGAAMLEIKHPLPDDVAERVFEAAR